MLRTFSLTCFALFAVRCQKRVICAPRVARAHSSWDVLSFCEMGTHYHLLAQLDEPNFAEAMQWLNGTYARMFNRTHGRRGHLFKESYEPKQIVTDSHLLSTVAYIALNPVEAGLASSPEEWPWSSYGGTIGVRSQWPFVADDALLAHFGSTREIAMAALRAFVEDRLDRRRVA